MSHSPHRLETSRTAWWIVALTASVLLLGCTSSDQPAAADAEAGARPDDPAAIAVHDVAFYRGVLFFEIVDGVAEPRTAEDAGVTVTTSVS